VRVILREVPDYALMAEVRMELATLFMRRAPDY
jgi:hypothetical protein